VRRWSVVILAALLLGGIAGLPAAAQTAPTPLVFELRQVTPNPVHQETLVTYEVLLRNDGTEFSNTPGDLLLDVPSDPSCGLPGGTCFGEPLQYPPGLCRALANQDVDCDTFSMAPGEQFTFVFEYLVRASPGDHQVTAWLTDPFLPTQRLSVVTTVEPTANLQVSWSHTRVGGETVRSATVVSFGPSTATGVRLTLTWQGDRTTPEPVSVTSSQGTCDPPAAASTRCDLGDLGPFTAATVDLVFRGRGAAKGLTTTATATSLTFEGFPSDNTATLTI
jgi:Domain of unknown function DUF11